MDMCFIGATNSELAEAFGVPLATLATWIKNNTDFTSAIKKGREAADTKIAKSIYRQALGYKRKGEKLFVIDGVVVHEPVIEYHPPNVTAAIFWLKNRRPDKWREKKDEGHARTGDVYIDADTAILAGVALT